MRTTEDGAATVEFALLLPLLMLILSGIIDFGRAYHAQVTLTDGARQGVRILAFYGEVEEVSTSLADPESPLITGAVGTVSVSEHVDCDSAEDAELVLATQFDFMTPLPVLPLFFGQDAFASGMTIRGKAVMRCGG